MLGFMLFFCSPLAGSRSRTLALRIVFAWRCPPNRWAICRSSSPSIAAS
jgi:hypothetical protein